MKSITRIKRTGSSRTIVGTTADVTLTTPVDGFLTQEDANIYFDERLEALEPLLTVVNGGTY